MDIAANDGDYRSFGEAIDTLNIVGVQGPVVFNGPAAKEFIMCGLMT